MLTLAARAHTCNLFLRDIFRACACIRAHSRSKRFDHRGSSCLALKRTHGRPHKSCRHILIPPTHSMSHPPADGCLSHRHRCCLVQTYTQAYTTYFAPLTLMDVRDRGSPLDPSQPCDLTHLTLLHRFLATPVEKQQPSVTCSSSIYLYLASRCLRNNKRRMRTIVRASRAGDVRTKFWIEPANPAAD